MELISWYELLLMAVQIGYSFALKALTGVRTKYIPLINFAVAAVTHGVVAAQAGLGWQQCVAQGLYKGLATMLVVTGAYSATKNTVEGIREQVTENRVTTG